MGARRHQFAGGLHQFARMAVILPQMEAACLDRGRIEKILDQLKKRMPAFAHGFEITGLLGSRLGLAQEVSHAENAVERGANLVADGGQEPRLGRTCLFRAGLGFGEFLACQPFVGHLAADCVGHELAVGVARGCLPPGPDALGIALSKPDLSPRVGLDGHDACLDQALADRLLDLCGLPENLVAGENAAVRPDGDENVAERVEHGAHLTGRLLRFPAPVQFPFRCRFGLRSLAGRMELVRGPGGSPLRSASGEKRLSQADGGKAGARDCKTHGKIERENRRRACKQCCRCDQKHRGGRDCLGISLARMGNRLRLSRRLGRCVLAGEIGQQFLLKSVRFRAHAASVAWPG